MDQPGSIEVLGGILSDALQNLTTVAEGVRVQGCNDEANKIGQLSIELVTVFNAASMKLQEQNHSSPQLPPAQPIPALDQGSSSTDLGGVEIVQAEPTSVAAEQGVPVVPPTNDFAQQGFQRVSGPENTWARVASAASDAVIPESRQFRVTRALKPATGSYQPIRAPNRNKVTGKDVVELQTNSNRQDRQDDHSNGLLEEGKAGVVIVEGPLRTISRFLSFFATRIHEGAIYDLSIVNETKAIAVFEYALHAQIFVDRNTELVATRGESIFGKGNWTVTLGNPLAWTETLKRMCHPFRERRRLTFVKSRLFADHGSYLKWIREVEDVAGSENVDFVWAFNTGNATAVFFSVAVARKVMQTFTNWRSNRGCYEDLNVTYSSDPCEKGLQLTTQLRYHVQPPHRRFEQLGPTGVYER